MGGDGGLCTPGFEGICRSSPWMSRNTKQGCLIKSGIHTFSFCGCSSESLHLGSSVNQKNSCFNPLNSGPCQRLLGGLRLL